MKNEQVVIVYKNRSEQMVDEFFADNPEVMLGMIAIFVGIFLFYVRR